MIRDADHDVGVPSTRATALFEQHAHYISARTDRLFAGLLMLEWFAGVLAAVWLSPRTWAGGASPTHLPVRAAVILGSLIVVAPAVLALKRPGHVITRHAVAVGQMLMGALLIHLTGGRIETHFFIFGSLAFLAFYRDWRVILTATIVVALDHIVRGVVWPQSVYGTITASPWRWVEHAGWVAFEDVFLVLSCVQGKREMANISDRHAQLEAQRDIQQSADVALAANTAKSAFLANMSHEIRTPMTAVLGFADLLLDPELGLSDRLSHVQIIRRNSEHLLSLIDDILDLSKIEAGKMTTESIACSPQRILAEVVSLMRVRALSKGLTMNVQFATPIPASIKSDPTRLRQILMNLLSNAIKFTDRGSITVSARCVDPTSAAPSIVFDVIDTGIGIDESKISRLLEPFTQADSSTTRKFGGTGLGLAISKRLATMLGGDLTLVSKSGAGSTFTVSVASGPLAGIVMLAEQAEAGTSEPAPPTRNSGRFTGNILLAEDGPDNQLLICSHLKRAGAVVTVAENGRIAVDKIKEAGAAFDLVLMDMQMPELDGYAATGELRARGYEGPIVALTAHAMAGDRQKCLAAGCDDYLTKPISRVELLSTVERYLTGAESRTAHVKPGADLVSEFAGDADMAEILHQFVRGLASRAHEVRRAAEGGDWETLRRLSHQLRGAAGGYGFHPITSAAASVEKAASAAADPVVIREQTEVLIDLCNRARASVAPSGIQRSA